MDYCASDSIPECQSLQVDGRRMTLPQRPRRRLRVLAHRRGRSAIEHSRWPFLDSGGSPPWITGRREPNRIHTCCISSLMRSTVASTVPPSTNPVPAGGRVRLNATLKSVESLPKGGVQVIVDGKVELEGTDRPAVVAEAISVLRIKGNSNCAVARSPTGQCSVRNPNSSCAGLHRIVVMLPGRSQLRQHYI